MSTSGVPGVGKIPDQWTVKTLKQLSPSQTVGVVINPSSYFDNTGTVPFLVGSNVGENSIAWQSARRISEVSNRTLAASRLSAGDLVTVRVGEPGITAVVPPELDGCNCASMMIVRQHSSFDSQWLCHVMNSRIGRAQVEGVQYGTAQKQFNISDAVNFTYPVPPLSEQKAIAAVLGDVDALIRALDRLIVKKRDLKQAAMQQLLTGQTRLPGFNGKWGTRPLGDVAFIRNQKVLPYQVDPDTLCIELEHLGQGDGRLLTSSTARASTSSKYRFVSGDVLFGRLRSYLRKYWIADRDGICTTEIWPLVVNPNLAFNGFLYALVQTTAFIEMAGISYGTHMPRADWAVIRAFQVRLPRLDEQVAIATALSDMDAELAALEQRIEKTCLLNTTALVE